MTHHPAPTAAGRALPTTWASAVVPGPCRGLLSAGEPAGAGASARHGSGAAARHGRGSGD